MGGRDLQGANERLGYNAGRRREDLRMPLLDHFNPPLSRTHPWRGFHGAWAAAMARLLNHGVLPPGYYAVPLVELDGPVEIDLATLHDRDAAAGEEAAAPQTWTPPAPGLAVAIDLPAVEAVEVQVFADDGDPRLRAAIELLSPRNKDPPQVRRTFAVKCVSYLQQGSSVVVVDTVTTRRANLHAAILSLLDREADAASLPAGLSAVSYQAVEPAQDAQELRIWSAALALGQNLPALPLWLAGTWRCASTWKAATGRRAMTCSSGMQDEQSDRPHVRHHYVALARTFAELAGRETVWFPALKELDMKDSAFLQEVDDRGIAKGTLVGKILLCQEMLKQPQTPEKELRRPSEQDLTALLAQIRQQLPVHGG
jgi:hypothetical protein